MANESTALYVQHLTDLLKLRRERNPSYSARALARDIGIDPADLTNILNGKKGVSSKVAYRLGIHLGLKENDLLVFIEATLK